MAPSKTAKLIGSAPAIFVRDVYAATEHYRDAMGFSFGEIFGEPPSFAILRRDNMYVMVKQIEDHKHIVPRWTVSAGLWDMYFWVDDVDALYKELVERGAKMISRTVVANSVRRISTGTISGSAKTFLDRLGLACPLWVKSRHMRCKTACPPYPQKRTSVGNS